MQRNPRREESKCSSPAQGATLGDRRYIRMDGYPHSHVHEELVENAMALERDGSSPVAGTTTGSPRGASRFIAVLLLAGATLSSCSYETTEIEAPEIPTSAESSSIFAAEGTLLTTLRSEENRASVKLEFVPEVVQDAVISIEDERFWEHNGVDMRAIVRAAKANTTGGEISQGGSTITQQYVKNAILTTDQTLNRKVEEAALAIQLERSYSKELILELYLNTIYFGNGAYGVQAASFEYFGRPVSDVSLAQAALLAGLIQAPADVDPYRNPQAATARRDLVLDRMLELEYITEAEHTEALAAPLGLADEEPTAEDQRYPAAHFVEEVKQWILEDDRFGETPAQRRDLLFSGGLRIHTTLDPVMQFQAELAIRGVLDEPGADPDAALVAIDPRTGHVKAMVGGYDFYGSHSYAKVNLARGKGRSTGSSFKPIVLAAALSEGIPPTETYPSPSSTTLSTAAGPWPVKGGAGLGSASLVDCTVYSSNTCYANLILDERIGPELAVDYAGRLGITTELQAVPSAVLGANDATVLDMASAYSTFANRGVHVPPVFVTKITLPDGSILYEDEHAQQEVLEPEVADTINGILEGVIEKGTGTDAAIDRPAAGKTGSAEYNTDAWFIGYTPDLVAAVWVGYAESGEGGLRRMQPPNTPITVFGGTYPAAIWSDFMSMALAGIPPSAFNTPEEIESDESSDDAAIFDLAESAARATVPGTIGQTAAAATATLQAAGFEVKVITLPAGSGPPGLVVGQAPQSGDSATAGARVVIEVVAGEPPPPPGGSTTPATGPPAPDQTGEAAPD